MYDIKLLRIHSEITHYDEQVFFLPTPSRPAAAQTAGRAAPLPADCRRSAAGRQNDPGETGGGADRPAVPRRFRGRAGHARPALDRRAVAAGAAADRRGRPGGAAGAGRGAEGARLVQRGQMAVGRGHRRRPRPESRAYRLFAPAGRVRAAGKSGRPLRGAASAALEPERNARSVRLDAGAIPVPRRLPGRRAADQRAGPLDVLHPGRAGRNLDLARRAADAAGRQAGAAAPPVRIWAAPIPARSCPTTRCSASCRTPATRSRWRITSNCCPAPDCSSDCSNTPPRRCGNAPRVPSSRCSTPRCCPR